MKTLCGLTFVCLAFAFFSYRSEGQPMPPCVGDCSGDREVAINDLLILVNIDLGLADPSACPHGIDEEPVTIDELIKAVNNALSGCAATPTPTPTPTPVRMPTFTQTPPRTPTNTPPFDLSGTWGSVCAGAPGATFYFSQEGTSVYGPDSNSAGTLTGSLSGNQLTTHYKTTDGTYSSNCVLTVAPGGNSMQGECTDTSHTGAFICYLSRV